MSTTHTSAHVCTPQPIPFSGMDPAAPGRDRAARYIQVTGSINFMPEAPCDRRFWVIDIEEPSDVPPPGALSFDSVLLPCIEPIAQLHRAGSNCFWVGEEDGNRVFLTRHHDEHTHKIYPERTNKWEGLMVRRDLSGHQWRRTVICVVDDFGWLVEVPAC